jgi:hypothetical protein
VVGVPPVSAKRHVKGGCRPKVSAMRSPEAEAELAALRTQVTPENVMLLHNGLKAEATFLNAQILLNLVPVGEPGTDLVSPQAAEAFNRKIDGLRERLTAYVDLLTLMADDMAATARRYGHTEHEIADSFARFYSSYPR